MRAWWWGLGLAALVAANGAAQSAPVAGKVRTLDHGLTARCVSMPNARGACVVLALGVGAQHDPDGAAGAAAMVGEALRLLAEPAPDAPSGATPVALVEVSEPAILLSRTGPDPSGAASLAALVELLRLAQRSDDDLLERARWRAALRADDESELIPGPILLNLARAGLLAGRGAARPVHGTVADIEVVDAGWLRQHLRAALQPRCATLVLVGGRSVAALEATVDRMFSELEGPRGPCPSVARHVRSSRAPTVRDHRRVAAPYAVHAWRSPEPEDASLPAFWLAMELVRARAVKALGAARGHEFWADCPPMRYDPLLDPVALVYRRARDGDQPDAVRAELAEFVADLRRDPPGAAEIEAARARLARQLGAPLVAVPGATVHPRALQPLARALAIAALRRWPDDPEALARGVPGEAVLAALEAAQASDRTGVFVLVPRAPVAPVEATAPTGEPR
ncbi:MAG: hypothetical protein AAF628_01595 [Planctomycetota bacterium]